MWTKLLSKSREHLNCEYIIFRDENILFLVPFNLFSSYSILLISFIEKELRIGFWSTSKQSRRSYLGTHNLTNYMISVFMEWLTHAQTPIWDLVSVSNQRSGLTPPGYKGFTVFLLPFKPPEVLRGHHNPRLKFSCVLSASTLWRNGSQV